MDIDEAISRIEKHMVVHKMHELHNAVYITEALENAIGFLKEHKWHDLTKNPNDVPIQEKNEKWHIVLDNFGNKCFYDNIINKWRRPETLDVIEPTAWCEVPKFKS
jgi:hypothetical protein